MTCLILSLNFVHTGLKDTAFFAALDQSKTPVRNSDIVIWKDVKYNNGGYYSQVTGAYTAPLAGYYQFTVSKTNAERWAYFQLLIDDEIFCFQGISINDATSWKQKSSTITVKLDAGSKVQIRTTDATELYGSGVFSSHPGMPSWFSGHLLFPA